MSTLEILRTAYLAVEKRGTELWASNFLCRVMAHTLCLPVSRKNGEYGGGK